jgi:two-component sensor histidine kinase
MNLFERKRLRSLFWTLHAAGWALFGLMMALSRLGRYPIGYMVVTKTVLAASGFVVALGLRAVYKRWLPENSSLQRTIGVTLAASYLMSLAWTAFYNIADARLVTELLGRPTSINSLSALFSEALYHAFALLAWSVLYVGIKRQLALQAATERALRAEALAHEARLQALRFQLQPHFLFNTLNAISTLVVEQRSQEASAMLSRLSEFLRFTLETSNGDEVPLATELELAQRYLDIETVRFGSRLRLGLNVSAEARGARVPTLLLQPLIENAVRHGVAPRRAGASLNLAAWRDREDLVLTVKDRALDPGEPLPQPASPGAGIGLSNTRARLEQLYGKRARFDVTRGTEEFGVEIRIPFRDHA